MVALLLEPGLSCRPPLAFDLPPELEARTPPEARGLQRDEVRLLVSDPSMDTVMHASFVDLPSFLTPGDLLVANDSATIPGALTARREDGTEFGLHLSTNLAGDVWVVEPRQTTVSCGERVALPAGASLVFTEPYLSSSRLWVATLNVEAPLHDYLRAYGKPIKYKYLDGEWPIEMYQTDFATQPGSAEMPSAGRPFSPRVLSALGARGVQVATITLHCGVASLESHEPPYPEWFEVTSRTALAISEARARGGRVVAVGTTVVRALESAVGDDGAVRPRSGWTDLVITAERGVEAVDGLLTGFHEPKASHLALLEAIAGRRHLEVAYAAALEGGYLWHEFGDVHLILSAD